MHIKPSIIALFANGLFLFLILVIILSNIENFLKIDYINKIMILSQITMVIAIHGLLHLGLEVNYNYNPLKWVEDEI